jgi:DNA polymerase IV
VVDRSGFDHDESDPDQHHRTVLALVEDLGGRFRDADEIAPALTLTITYVDRAETSRTGPPRHCV